MTSSINSIGSTMNLMDGDTDSTVDSSVNSVVDSVLDPIVELVLDSILDSLVYVAVDSAFDSVVDSVDSDCKFIVNVVGIKKSVEYKKHEGGFDHNSITRVMFPHSLDPSPQ